MIKAKKNIRQNQQGKAKVGWCRTYNTLHHIGKLYPNFYRFPQNLKDIMLREIDLFPITSMEI